MHALGSERIAKEVLRRLKFDNDTLHKVTRLVLNHDYRMPAVPKNVRRAMNKIGEDIFHIIWKSEGQMFWRKVSTGGQKN